jgi:hypothetical protein
MFGQRRSVGRSPDLERIRDLPVRQSVDAASLDDLLRTPEGKEHLRPLQIQALYEAGTYGGLFAPLCVGSGKTLISLLVPYVIECKRPLLLLPAGLIEKTERERRLLARHWRIPRNIRLFSYEMLGRVSAARTLEFYRPDLIIADECHKLKNKRAGVTRRVARYMHEYPETKFVAMSGTICKDSIRDFAHILHWTHKQLAPVPLQENTIEEWSNALDERVNPLSRIEPGALLQLAEGLEGTGLERARKGFRRRLVCTPATLASSGAGDIGCSLYIRGVRFEVNCSTERNFKQLRTLWERPDGWACAEAVEIWRHARELALGLHYRWKVDPPQEWLGARRVWAKHVREVLSRSRTLDTELHVANAIDDGKCEGKEFLNAWRRIKPIYKISSEPVWHDDSALEFCERWGKQGPGIIWCEHQFFGSELAKRTGWFYFGSQGLDSTGKYIEDARGTIIASVAANSTGRNLQKKWHRNLITASPAGATTWEQLIGRTHREGQEADEVSVDVMVGCLEHVDGWHKALGEAAMQKDMIGHEQKILTADTTMPEMEDIKKIEGWRWHK